MHIGKKRLTAYATDEMKKMVEDTAHDLHMSESQYIINCIQQFQAGMESKKHPDWHSDINADGKVVSK